VVKYYLRIIRSLTLSFYTLQEFGRCQPYVVMLFVRGVFRSTAGQVCRQC
jgi:hypothetical protein